MSINPTSIFVTILITIGSLLRILYVLVKNKKIFPDQLFKGRYLIFVILAFIFDLSSIILSLLFSSTFYFNGSFIIWCSLTFCFLCLYLILWVLFWMHGYDIRYQFEKVLLPSPMSILSFLILFISGIFTLNYYLLFSSVCYFVFEYLWSYKGFMLTKPKIIKEKNYYDE